MINKISFQPSASVTMKQASKKDNENSVSNKSEYVSNPVKSDSRDILANYGKSMINIVKSMEIPPVDAIDCKNIDNIKGERVYDSDGKLVLIVDEKENEKTNYYISEKDPKHVDYIEIINKQTNKVVFTQHCKGEDSQCSETFVTKFNSKTGKEEAFSCYENDKIAYAGKNSTNKYGDEISIIRDFQGYGYSLNMQNPNKKINKHLHISEDKKDVHYSELKQTPNGEIEKKVKFHNGLPFVVEEHKRNVIPNIIALEPLLDSDLTPSKFNMKDLEEKIKNAKGEETRFSNGNLESKKAVIDGEEVEAFFDFNNKLKKVIAPSYSVEKEDGQIKLKENLGEGIEKETIYSKGMTEILYNDNGYRKELVIDLKTNQPIKYSECDDKTEKCKTFCFDEKGMVDYIY